MTHQCFDVDIQDQIAHVVLNRPEKRNSMTPAFWSELPAIVEDIDGGARARVLVLSSTGPHFSSGMDVDAFESDAAFAGRPSVGELVERSAALQHGARFMESLAYFQRAISCLEACRLPVLAAIQGGCIGGGVDLVSACDMRYATADAFLSIFEINIGMTADIGTFPRLVKLVPEGIVRELAYTGRRMPAEEARAIGLVNRVFADQRTMLEGVMAIAGEIASKAPTAVYGCKRMITYSRDHSTADTLDYVGVWNASMLLPEEIREAMRAAAEKRVADFVDLPPRRGR